VSQEFLPLSLKNSVEYSHQFDCREKLKKLGPQGADPGHENQRLKQPARTDSILTHKQKNKGQKKFDSTVPLR
jgi:hypothetical protein